MTVNVEAPAMTFPDGTELKISAIKGEEQMNEEDGGKSETFWINLVYVFGHKIFFLKSLKKKIETQQKQGNLTEY